CRVRLTTQNIRIALRHSERDFTNWGGSKVRTSRSTYAGARLMPTGCANLPRNWSLLHRTSFWLRVVHRQVRCCNDRPKGRLYESKRPSAPCNSSCCPVWIATTCTCEG